jgi:uncharacterized membrane protein
MGRKKFDATTTFGQWMFCGFFVVPWVVIEAYAGCPKYHIQIGHAPPCQVKLSSAGPTALNSLGQVVGSYSDCAGLLHPFIWSGEATVSPIPNLNEAVVTGVNSSLHIVGWRDAPTRRGFIYVDGEVTDLELPSRANYQEALAINEQDHICGYTNNVITGPLRAFVWENGQLQDLNLPLLYNAAEDINELREVTGWMAPTGSIHVRTAFIWTHRSMIDLGPIPGGYSSEGVAINNLRQVAGRGLVAYPNPAGFVRRSFFWSDGQMVDLGLLPGFIQTLSKDLNDSGQIVGSAAAPNMPGKAFLWQSGAISRLDDLIGPDALVSLRDAVAINDQGQIAALGDVISNGQTVVALLTPVSPPPGDCDCNGVVNTDDLMAVIREWGPAIPTTTADFDLDLDVDMDDLLTVINMWG